MMPAWSPSEEATAPQLQLARTEGDAVHAELEWVRRLRALSSGEMSAGEYKVAYVIEPAMGWRGGVAGAEAHAADSDAVNVGIVVRDGADGRNVPGLTVHASVVDENGRELHSGAMPYGWMPVINRYADEFALPRGGRFTLRVRIEPPRYRRHDPVNGDRYADSTIAEFTNVTLDSSAARGSASNESPKNGELLARAEGDALGRSLYEMIGGEAVNGTVMHLGDYLVAVGVEYSEGYWAMRKDDLHYFSAFEQSAARNAHVEVGVMDGGTGRALPDLKVTATLIRDGKPVGTMSQPFMWHPWLFHYGENWRIPRSGRYDIRVHVDAPAFRRYGDAATRFASAIDTTFTGIKIVAGEK